MLSLPKTLFKKCLLGTILRIHKSAGKRSNVCHATNVGWSPRDLCTGSLVVSVTILEGDLELLIHAPSY